MYLKSIEIQGFKSFANKILFEFHDGITGIVGPNGSGKSNVADAVRWVLGEQSAKQLRGSKMEDVIFSGTQLRKPQGFAFVEITFDNKDHTLPIEFEEVRVARRVYRSGESEYLLNGSSCRLKDVQEMFFDTGIGKEGYSIIGQGQIEKILSGKPDERRELFDEAAGIVKYKKRKAAAEKQLEEEKLNFSRIADILAEIEKQLGPLEKQQAVAREYLKRKEELKTLEVNAFLVEQEKQEAAEAALREKISLVQGDLSDTEHAFESSKAQYEQLVEKAEQLSAQVEQNHTGINEKQLLCKQKENEINLFTEQISSIKTSESHYKERKSVVLREIEEKQKERDRYLAEREAVEQANRELSDSKSDADQELADITAEIAGYSNEIENRNADVLRYLTENGAIKSEIQRVTTLREQILINKASLTQQILKTESENSIAKNETEEKRKQLSEINEKIEQQKSGISLLQEKLSDIIKEGKDTEDSFREIEREFIREQSKAESLRNISERYDGYGNGIRRVMEQKEKERGILGVVADIFQVGKKYETAIETALGGNIQNIVTDTEDTAKKMIEFLKQNKAGRATFLPLDSVTAKTNSESKDIEKEHGVIGFASDLVTTEPQFLPVIRFLLGRIVVTDQVQNALALARKYRHTLRIVTLEGEQLNPGGSISGGAYKNASNLLSRKREVDEAMDAVEKLKKKLSELSIDKERLKNKREQLSKELNEKKERLQEAFLKQNTAKLLLSREETKEKDKLQSDSATKKELMSLELQEKELTKSLQDLNARLSKNEEDSKHNEECIEDCNHMLSEERRKEHYAVEKCESMKLELNTVYQKLSYLEENQNRIESDLKKLISEEEQLQNDGGNAIFAVQQKEKEIDAAKDEIHQLLAEIETMQTETKSLIERREETTKKHKAILSQRDTLSERKSELDKELFRLTDRSEKVKEQIEAINTYMWDEYELTLSEAQKLKTGEVENLNATKRQINDIKNKIKNLGPVNVNSIEEYKECFERHVFLAAQRDDLLTARENLEKMIAELDEKMRVQFKEKFEEIKQQFDLVFGELFGGGKGTLQLAEEEDILTAGILINAQPPGKKLQNMMQLSGGEKALTAISLLFAIQNLKPSPFCLLDEIEAALDDSNVKRYAGYLHKLTDHTQFIVITHRRGTMTAADVLYGITMQEKGVSTLVSVSLIEDKLDA